MDGLLRIARLRADCHVAGEPAFALAVRDGAARALRDHVPGALRGSFARWFDRDDESVWVVRRLHLNVAIAADTPADLLADEIASALGDTLAASLKGDGDGVNAIRFARRSDYLAQFVTDIAAGDPWGRWYYAPFANLKFLPTSAAIRTALIENPGRGLAALASLDDLALASVAAALAPADETRALDAFATALPATSKDVDDVLNAAWAGYVRAAAVGVVRGRTLFSLMRASTASASVAVLHAVHQIVDAVRAAEAAGPAELARLIDAFANPESRTQALKDEGRRSEASATVTDDGRVGDGGPAPKNALAAPHAPMTTSSVAGRRVAAPYAAPLPLTSPSLPMYSRFGGLSLLLRDLYEQPWDIWTAGWPAIGACPPAILLKWLTAALCMGRDQAADVLADAVWRQLLGIPQDITNADLTRWLRQIGHRRRGILARAAAIDAPAFGLTRSECAWLRFPRSAGISAAWAETLAALSHIILRRFAGRLPGFADSPADYLWQNFFAFQASVELEEARVIVKYGRPPLHLVLTLTGMTRGLLAGHDPYDRPILLFPGD